MVRIFINARFLTQPMSGVQRYAYEILSALDRLLCVLGDAPVVAYYPAGCEVEHPDWKHIELRALHGGTGHFWEQGALWRASRNGILISLCNSGPVLHKKQIVALHDANIYVIPQAFSWQYRVLHKCLRPVLARRAFQLVTVSAFSVQELSRYCRVSPSKFRIVPNSANHILRHESEPDVLVRFGLHAGKYLLAVGNQTPNKNVARLVAACAETKDLAVLAIVGSETSGLADAGISCAHDVQVLGRVTDEALCALYKGAMGFVWPSLYEGFGIPPLEAMALGIPVLASRSSAMPEILGDAALYFDPEDTADIQRALNTFCAMSEIKRDQMRSKGYDRAHRYSWEQSAVLLLDMLNLPSAGPMAHAAE